MNMFTEEETQKEADRDAKDQVEETKEQKAWEFSTEKIVNKKVEEQYVNPNKIKKDQDMSFLLKKEPYGLKKKTTCVSYDTLLTLAVALFCIYLFFIGSCVYSVSKKKAAMKIEN